MSTNRTRRYGTSGLTRTNAFATRVAVPFTLAAALAAFCSIAAGEDKPAPRTIAVTGTAEIEVVPDQAQIRLGVETFAGKLADAKSQNDERVKKVLAAATAAGVAEVDLQTGYVSILPRYDLRDGNYRYDKLLGYSVRKSIEIRVRDTKKLDALLAAALDAGANQVYGVVFQNGNLRRQKDEARAMALDDAQSKAAQMAQALGQKIRTPLAITEEADIGIERTASYSSSFDPSYISAASTATTFAPGQITITVRVAVTFELE